MDTFADNTFHPAVNIGVSVWLVTTDGDKQRIDMSTCMEDPDGLKCHLWRKTINDPTRTKANCVTPKTVPKQIIYYERHYPLWRLKAKIKKWNK